MRNGGAVPAACRCWNVVIVLIGEQDLNDVPVVRVAIRIIGVLVTLPQYDFDCSSNDLTFSGCVGFGHC
jgi:hypothetical protein